MVGRVDTWLSLIFISLGVFVYGDRIGTIQYHLAFCLLLTAVMSISCIDKEMLAKGFGGNLL